MNTDDLRQDAADAETEEYLCANPFLEARSAVLFAGDCLDNLLELVHDCPAEDQREVRDDLVFLEIRIVKLRRALQDLIRDAAA